jgi:enamine deaminase RidA (YjgF/YER057c/UK114 family)
MSAETRLADLGITLPEPPAAAGLYAPCVQSGNLVFLSGQIPLVDGKVAAVGKLGAGVSVETGQELARTCAINALAIVRGHLGSLDRVVRVVRVGAFVASAPHFIQQPEVANGASQLLIDVFGDAGRHARAAVGTAELPRGVPVEVEFVFEVSGTAEAPPQAAAPGERAEPRAVAVPAKSPALDAEALDAQLSALSSRPPGKKRKKGKTKKKRK